MCVYKLNRSNKKCMDSYEISYSYTANLYWIFQSNENFSPRLYGKVQKNKMTNDFHFNIEFYRILMHIFLAMQSPSFDFGGPINQPNNISIKIEHTIHK